MKENRKEKIITSLLKGSKIPKELIEWIKSQAKQADTPQYLAGILYDLASELSAIASTLADFYRSNWHSIYCECDECMKLAYGEYLV